MAIIDTILSTLKLPYVYRRILFVTSRAELQKRYSGSLLGGLWILIYPLMFLSVYLFVYLVVFKVKFPGFSDLDYVLYIFSGLVPYIAFMETLLSGAQSVRQNIHLIKNVIMPIELAPVRAVTISMVTFSIGMVMAISICAISGNLSMKLVLLPLALVLFCMFLVGLAQTVSALGVVLPDIQHFLSPITLLLVFVSPIGFKPDMVPPNMAFIVYLNPVHYMLAPFRAILLNTTAPIWFDLGISVVLSLSVFALGSLFFNKFKKFLTDYE